MATLSSHWRLMPLFTCLILATCLMASWISQAGFSHWSTLDAASFYTLNGLLADNSMFQALIAFCSTHLFDAMAGVTLMLPFVHYIRSGGSAHVVERVCIGLFMALYIFFIFQLLRITVDYPRQSPSHLLTPFYDLMQLKPSVPAKVYASGTFPSDHGMVMLMVTAFVWYFAGPIYGVINSVMTVLFCLPRLIAGAHWLTDMVVGSTIVALIATSLALATPMQAIVTQRLREALRKLPRLERFILCVAGYGLRN